MPSIAEIKQQYPDLAGLDDEQVVDAVHQAFYPDLPRDDIASSLGFKPAPPPVPERSALRAVGDVGLSLGQGAIGAFKSLTDLAGADNAASETLGSMSKFLGDQKSEQSKATLKASQERVKAAEESGSTWEEAKAYMGMLLDQPGEFLAQGVGSFATLGLGKIAQAAKLAGAARAAGVSKEAFLASKAGMEAIKEAAKFGFKANVGIGALQGVGAVKGSQYEQTYQSAIQQGMSEEDAAALAAEAQSYGGPGTMQQVLGGALGGVAAATGPIERMVMGRGGQQAATGTMAAIGKGFATEAIPEGAQGAQERFAGNEAAIDAGVLDPSRRYQGVAGQGLMEGTIGGVIGGVAGPFEAQAPINMPESRERPPVPPIQPAASPAGPMARAVQKAPVTGTGAPSTESPIVGTSTVKVDGQVSTKVTRQDGSEEIDGVQVTPPTSKVEPDSTLPADDVIDVEPITPVKPSEAMGIDLAANPLVQATQAPAPTTPVVDTESLKDRTTDELRGFLRNAQDTNIRKAISSELARRKRDLQPVAPPVAQVQPTDILNPSGQPFKTRRTAQIQAKKTAGEVVEVEGGFVVRPPEIAGAKTQEASQPATQAAAGQGAATDLRADGVPGVDQPQPLGPLSNEQDAPQPSGIPGQVTQAQAAQAPEAARGDGAAAAGVPAAGTGASDVQAPGVTSAPQIFTGKSALFDGFGASVGSVSDGNKRQLMVDPAGGYFWGDWRQEAQRDVGAVAGGADKDAIPASFATGKEAREAAEATPAEKTVPADVSKNTPKLNTSPELVQKTAKSEQMPARLAGAKPRYSYGQKQFGLEFESDVDLAAYVVAQGKTSSRDADYLKFVMDATGLDEAGARAYGRQVRDAIKAQAKDAEPGTLTVPKVARGATAPEAMAQDKPAPFAKKEDLDRLFGVDQKRKAALDRIAKGTAYFSTKEKAADFVAKSGIKDTHEVVQAKPGRFEVRAKSFEAATTAQSSSSVPSLFNGESDARNSAPMQELGGFKVGEVVDVPSRTVGRSTVETLFQRTTAGMSMDMARIVGANGKRLDVLTSELSKVEADPAASPLVQAMNDLADVNARIEQQGQVVDDRLVERQRKLRAMVKELEASPEPRIAPPNATERYNAMVERWNDLVNRYKAADAQGKAIIQQEMDLLDADMKAARRESLMDVKREVAEAGRREQAKLQGEYEAMPLGTRLRPSEFDAEKGIFWEKTGGDEWTARGEWFQKGKTRTSASLAESGGLVKGKAEIASPVVSANTIFTEDAAAAARARLKAKLGRLNSGIDPEMLMDGITLAGYHIEKGARTFAAYAKAMVGDLGDGVKPYLKSWYMGVKYDPRAAKFDGMDEASTVEKADLDKLAEQADTAPSEKENATRALDRPGQGALEGAPAQDVQGTAEAGPAERAPEGGRGGDQPGDAGTDGAGVRPPRGVGSDAGAVPVSAGRARSQRGGAGQRRAAPDARDERGSSLFGDDGAGDRRGEAGRVEPPAFQPTDFTIEEDFALGEGGQKAKYRANVEAIRLLQTLEAEQRYATPDEQKVLAKYVGWGGIPQAFDGENKDWSREFAELRELLSDEEYSAARRSTRYAHYTSRPIIQGMYDAMKRFGFTGGKILEPGAGVGNFMGLMPADLRSSSRMTGVERERIAAGIARHLYPSQNMQLQDFTQFNAQDGYFDAVIGNPPFAADGLVDQSGRKHLSGMAVHDYFFAKSVDMLRDGGVFAAVVSNGFMDKAGDRARKYIGERTKLLGAIRLPNNAFAKNANTEVTTDIVFLQKLPESEWGSKAAKADLKRWLDVTTIPDPKGGDPIKINQYFADNPQMMLGEYGRFGTMYGPDQPALVARPGQDTAALLGAAIERLPAGVYQSAAVIGTNKATNDVIDALRDQTVQEGGFYVDGGKLYQRMPDVAGESSARLLTPETQWTEKTTLGESRHDRLVQLAGMRRTLRDLLAAELADDQAMEGLRKRLNQQYDAYAAKHGLINDPSTAQVFDDDPDFPLLAALELNYTRGMGPAAAKAAGIKPYKSKADKAPIFARRVIEKRQAVQKAETPEDALNVSIAERGRIDAGYIGQLLGRPADEVLEELTKGDKPALFVDPVTGEHVLRDAYLSGNVRKKLQQAEMAGMDRNVRALMEVQPEDVGAHEIVARIGSPWVPTDVYQDFIKDLLGEGTQATVVYVPTNSSFFISVKPGSETANNLTYGTRKMDAESILNALLNNRTVKVTYTDSEGKTHLDKEGTDAAIEKAADIKAKFQDWIFADPERSEVLVRAYNDTNNNYITRIYDGARMQFPGKVPDAIIKFRRHQRNAIARIVQDRTALLDHVVGAGKTFTVIAGAMELKRTGLAKKPLIVVPNHLVKQWAADFYRLYPGANILTATKKDFARENRRRFLAKIATGDWDAVIMAHSSFGFVKPDPDFEMEFNEKQVAHIKAALAEVEASDGDKQNKKRTVKQLEAMAERLENRIKSLRDKPVDSLLDFKQIGVDQLFVDEAHLFKNLMFSTKMQNVQGLGDSKGSQRAYDMYVKTAQIYAQNGRGQGVVFATGTPVSNTLAEMYHMMRYLMPAAMDEVGFQSFDAWANTFASVDQVWMQKPSGDGYKASDRLGSFNNAPELLKMFDQVSDTVTMDDIKKAYAEENGGKEFPLPKLKGDRRTPVSLAKSDAQNAYMEEIAARALKLEQKKGPPQKGEDNFLTIMSDARKAAMDIRLVDPDRTTREPGARIDRATDEVVKRYKQFDGVKGVQLVFSDLGTPLKSAKKELKEYEELKARIDAGNDTDLQADAALGDEAAQAKIEDAEAAQEELDAKGPDWLDAIKAALRGFSVYDDFKAALIEKGIPENEIAFIHDFNTDDQKAALFRKVNAGQIRVVLGSTPKMGAGTNVQERLVALHHLDVPWKPSDIEQREGRIIRQGNRLADTIPGFEVEILAYVTQDTLDMRMWQTQEVKLKMINQLRTRQISREIENPFEQAEMSAGEMQAAATGNMDLLREIQLRTDVKKLEQRKRSFDAQRNDLASRRKRAAESLRRLPGEIAELEILAKGAQDYFTGLEDRPFKATINGDTYTSRAEAGAKLRELTSAHEAALEARREAAKTARESAGQEFPQGSPERASAQLDAADAFEKNTPKPKMAVEFNGKTYGSKAALGEAMTEFAGDSEPIAWRFEDQEIIRRKDIAEAIEGAVSEAYYTDTVQQLGSIGEFKVTVEGQRDRMGNPFFELVVDRQGKTLGTTIRVGGTEKRQMADAVVKGAERLLASMPDKLQFAKYDLARAKKAMEELEKTSMPDTWPDMDKLEKARAEHKEVLKRLAGEDKPTGDQAAGDTPAFSRSTGNPDGISKKTAADVVDAIRSRWANSPEVVVVSDMQDPAVPQRVREADLEQRSMGATGEPEGFWYGGKVYIVSGALSTPGDVVRVLFHESLGHYGLRGVFGESLTPILRQIASLRRNEIVVKAFEYGLVPKNLSPRATMQEVWAAMSDSQRLQAAEEVLAVMAQTKPEMGYVKRALAAIRAWLRKNVPGFQGMKLTDGEIIQQYILPARRFVEQGSGQVRQGPMAPAPAFVRGQGGIDQTQTPEFKRWFGDWQALAAQKRLDAMKPVKVNVPAEWRGLPVAELRERVRGVLDEMVRSRATIEHPELGSIRVGRAGERKTISEGRDPAKLLIAADLENVLPNSILAGQSASEGSQNILGFAKLIARVEVDGDPLVAVFAVRQQTDGSWYYNTTALEKTKAPTGAGASTSGPVRGSTAEAEGDPLLTEARPFSRKSLAEVNPDSVSKVVDEQGRPLVVYHGTNKDFKGFAEDRQGSNFDDYEGAFPRDGFWFTANPDNATWYANVSANGLEGEREGGGQNIKPVYLKITNPFRYTAEMFAEEGEAGIPSQAELEEQGYDGIIVEVTEDDDGSTMPEEAEAMWDKYQPIYGAAMNWPADLRVQYNELLDAPPKIKHTHYVAFRPEQIKSATGNNGQFDPDNADIRFSRASVREVYKDLVPEALRDRLTDIGTSQRGFNRWWHTTVGTQLHKAKINKDFGRVYYAVQDFMKDVSRMATNAADLAPDLLPQIDGVGDIRKMLPKMTPAGYRQRKADLKAASDALFDGTLRYTRDGYGEPVEAQNTTDAGIVWTDEELRARGLNEQAIKLYRQARSAINLSLDNLMASDVYRMLTLAEPETLARTPQEHADLMAKIRKAAASDKPNQAVSMAAQALDAQADQLRKQIKELEKQGKQDPETQGITEAIAQAKESLKAVQDIKKRLDDKFERVSELKAQGYAPLSRFGRYAVDVLDEDGNRAFFGLYETQYEANRAARRFSEQGFQVSQSVKSVKEFEMLKGLSPETAMLFAELLGVEKDQAMQVWLQNALAEQSALKRQIRRKGVEGFDEDASRVVAAFITSNSRAASRALHALRIQEGVDNVRQGDVKDEAKELADYVNNPKEEAQAIRSLLFFNYIGGSISSALVNLTQTVVQTFPYLSQYGGARKSAARVTSAMKLAMGKIDDAELAAAVKRAEEDGVIKPQEVFQLQAEASRTLGSNLYARTGLALWGSFFQIAETFNRRVAFIAAYQTAKQEGIANPFAFAENAVDETQSVFNKGSRPNWARGALGATLFTFKTFTVQYVEFLKRLPPKERALALGVLVLLAGFRGLPFAEDAEDLVDTVAQGLGYNFTTKEQMDRFLVATLGRPFADFLQHGASGTGLIPFDVSQRLGMSDLLPGTGLLKASETRKEDQVLEVVGVAGSFVRDALKGEFRPIAIRNAAKAVEMYDQGIYTDTRGRKVMDVTPLDAAFKSIGLQPSAVAAESRAVRTQYEKRALFTKVKSEISEQIALGQFENDKDKIQKARERLADWNEKNPEARIVLNTQAIRRRVVEMRRDRTERFIRSSPRELRAQLVESMQ